MKIAIIGAGAMGGAIAEGLLRSGAYENHHIVVSNRTPAKLERFRALGATVTTDNVAAACQADVIVIAVKPWLVQQVLSQLPTACKDVVSVAAGITLKQLRQWTDETASLWLAMPNIAAAYGASMTFVVSELEWAPGEASQVKRLFDTVGQTIFTDEQHLPAATALSGCGIAYALRYVRAASEGGVELGFKADEARQIVMQTLEGAVSLLRASGLHPEQAIDLVTTPGGMTIRGLNEMEHAGFTSAVVRGLKASLK